MHVPKSTLSNSAHKSAASNRANKSTSKHKSMKKQKTSSNCATKSTSKHRSMKKQKISSKSDNSFDVFGNPIDCSEFDNFFKESNVDSSLYPWVERRLVRKG